MSCLDGFFPILRPSKRAMKKKDPWLFRVYVGIVLPSYVGITRKHYGNSGVVSTTIFPPKSSEPNNRNKVRVVRTVQL